MSGPLRVPVAALQVAAERAFVHARLGWVCIVCRRLFVGRPREGFVTCTACSRTLKTERNY